MLAVGLGIDRIADSNCARLSKLPSSNDPLEPFEPFDNLDERYLGKLCVLAANFVRSPFGLLIIRIAFH